MGNTLFWSLVISMQSKELWKKDSETARKGAGHEYEAFQQANWPALINYTGGMSDVFIDWMRKNRSGDGWRRYGV